MINSAEGFIKLRSSQTKAEYDRSAHEEAPIEVWREIITNHCSYRKWVVHNKTVPLEILETLYEKDESMRIFIARKRKLSQKLFEALARDPDRLIRGIISINRKTPLETLELLLQDRDSEISKSATANCKSRT